MATEAQQLVEFGLVVEEGAEVLRGALGCVRSVLSNIHQHPDNEKLRRIRINHPAIRVSAHLTTLLLHCCCALLLRLYIYARWLCYMLLCCRHV